MMRKKNTLSRRTFLKAGIRVTAGTALASGVGGAYSIWLEPHSLAIESVEVRLKRLPPAFDGFRLVQLSDLHYENATPAWLVGAAVDVANKLDADLIVMTGDYVTTNKAAHIDGCTRELGRLRAKHGVVGVLGNHDVWSAPEKIKRKLEAQGISMLENQSIALERDGARLWVVGLGDMWEKLDDIERALRGVPDDEAKLLLVHEPDFADLAKHYPIDLQLSGHTHGGQVRLPLFGALALPRLGQKYPIGLQRADELLVYTSRGVGLIQPAVRFNCKPEVTVFTLRSSA